MWIYIANLHCWSSSLLWIFKRCGTTAATRVARRSACCNSWFISSSKIKKCLIWTSILLRIRCRTFLSNFRFRTQKNLMRIFIKFHTLLESCSTLSVFLHSNALKASLEISWRTLFSISSLVAYSISPPDLILAFGRISWFSNGRIVFTCARCILPCTS